VVLGFVSGLFGVKGWVKVHSHTDPREAILSYPDWLMQVDGRWERVEIAEGKPHGKTIVARIAGIEDRDGAASLVNAQIGVERADLPETDKDQYYWSDLVGLAVVHKDGTRLGKVDYLLETGANDVLVVEQADREVLIPFVTGDVVQEVDIDNGVIRVDWEWD
jgi:16S rRNA processing protein RimM